MLDILVNNSGGGKQGLHHCVVFRLTASRTQYAVTRLPDCYGEEDVRREPLWSGAVTQGFAALLIASRGSIVNIRSIVGKFLSLGKSY